MGRLKKMLSWLSRKKTESQVQEVFRLHDKSDPDVCFVINRDTDPDFKNEYYFTIAKKDKLCSDIVINVNKDQAELQGLLQFLKTEVDKGKTKFFYLNCDCLSDMYRFVKDEDQQLYIEYWTFGGQGRRSCCEDVSTDNAKDLAEFLEGMIDA